MNGIQAIQKWLINFWNNLSFIKRIILAFVIVLAVGLLMFLFFLDAGQSPKVILLRTNVDNINKLDDIIFILDEQKVSYQIIDNLIYVNSVQDARKVRDILVRDDLLPSQTDPWDLFDIEKWTTTDFERNINVQRAIKKQLENHIKALEDIETVRLDLVIPKKELFSEQQDPTTASVTLIPSQNSDVLTNSNKIKGIEKLIAFAVPGLKIENIVITGPGGEIVNDFFTETIQDRMNLAREQLKFKNILEQQYRKNIVEALSIVFSPDRVKLINVNVSVDMDKKTITERKINPIVIKPQTIGLPYDDSQVIPSLVLEESRSVEQFEGMGYTPEGPPGVDGQVPPGYKDKQNLNGKYNKEESVIRNVMNELNISNEVSPWSIKNVRIGVLLDGIWDIEKDDQGNPVILPDGRIKRVYTPVLEEELSKVTEAIQASVDFNLSRGDSIVVQNVQFDRSQEHMLQDEKFFKSINQRKYVNYFIIVVAGFILFLVIVYAIIVLIRLYYRKQKALLILREEKERLIKSMQDTNMNALDQDIIDLAKNAPEELARVVRFILNDKEEK